MFITPAFIHFFSRRYIPAAQGTGKSAPWVSSMMFYGGIFFLAIFGAGLLVFAYKIIPKTARVKTCPAGRFSRARRIVIPLPINVSDIVLKPADPFFKELADNFTDDKKAPLTHESYPVKLFFLIGYKRYAVEVCVDGWNFLGEERASRSLRNSQRVLDIIDSLKAGNSKRL